MRWMEERGSIDPSTTGVFFTWESSLESNWGLLLARPTHLEMRELTQVVVTWLTSWSKYL